MAAYVIFIRDRVLDDVEMRAYAASAKLARGNHKIKPLVYYGASKSLEGPAVDGVVILQFDDMVAAHAWYDSPAYRQAKEHRLRGADYRVVLAEGI